jgi:hypothetical protein
MAFLSFLIYKGISYVYNKLLHFLKHFTYLYNIIKYYVLFTLIRVAGGI